MLKNRDTTRISAPKCLVLVTGRAEIRVVSRLYSAACQAFDRLEQLKSGS
jgi:hypothetical protein